MCLLRLFSVVSEFSGGSQNLIGTHTGQFRTDFNCSNSRKSFIQHFQNLRVQESTHKFAMFGHRRQNTLFYFSIIKSISNIEQQTYIFQKHLLTFPATTTILFDLIPNRSNMFNESMCVYGRRSAKAEFIP